MDHFEKYNENPGELAFFTQIVRLVVDATSAVSLEVEPIVPRDQVLA